MIKVVRVAEMVAIEKEADASGWSYARMMEKAGFGLAEALQDAFSRLVSRRVLGLVGSGNNGGDTLVALAHLARHGWHASAYLVRGRPDSDLLVERLRQAGGEVFSVDDDPENIRLRNLLGSNPVVLDGVLGTGVRLPLREETARILTVASETLQRIGNVHVVAVDCPSGVDCDSGEAAEHCIPAEMTVSMAAAKQGLLKFPAANYVGDLRFVGIGLGENTPYPPAWQKVNRFLADRAWVRGAMPIRPMNAHKGTFGTVVIAAGCQNYCGAALLAGKAAYRSGAGLVTMAVPRSLHPILAGQIMEATWLLMPESEGGLSGAAAPYLKENLGRATTLLVGPGLGQAAETQSFIANLLTVGGKFPPLVVDADGLRLLAKLDGWWDRLPRETILTPHPGEMAALTGLSMDAIQAERVEIAETYAQRWGHVVILKGAYTVIAAPDGRTSILPVATPALAKAGSGDVLAGVVTGLRGQGLGSFEAATAGAWIHAQAGLHAATRLGSTTSVVASDLLESLIKIQEHL